MSLDYRRTAFDQDAVRTYHVCPAGTGTIYDWLVNKYGGDNVYQFDVAGVFMNALMGKVNDAGNDHILFYPGSYAPTTTMTVSKGCVIRGASPNPSDARIAHGAGTTIGFTITGAGVTIQGLTFLGVDADVKSITFSGARLLVEDCIFEDCKLAISGTGAYSLVRRCIIDSDNAAAIGVDLLAAASFGRVLECDFQLSGTTGDTGVKVNAAALKCLIGRCRFNSGCSDAISLGAQTGDVNDTETSENTKNNETTAAWIAD